jgi:iron complex transport system ATP-binding protein
VGGRERLLADVAELLDDALGPTVVLVTHHLEEVPWGISDAVLLRDGRIHAAGPATRVLTSPTVSGAFGLPIEVDHDRGRYRGRVVR